MKHLLAALTLFTLFLAIPVVAQEAEEHAAETAAHGEAEGHGDVLGGPNATLWKTVNFVLLVGGAIYLLRGKVGPFFAARNKAIAKGMADADLREQEAQARLQAIEAKLEGLENDIASLRENASQEMERDRQRIQAETSLAIERLRESAESEIASATATARARLQHHAASLSLELAEQQVRAEAKSADAQQRLLNKAMERLRSAGDASRN